MLYRKVWRTPARARPAPRQEAAKVGEKKTVAQTNSAAQSRLRTIRRLQFQVEIAAKQQARLADKRKIFPTQCEIEEWSAWNAVGRQLDCSVQCHGLSAADGRHLTNDKFPTRQRNIGIQ